MTRTLTIIALLFATPAWANLSEHDKANQFALVVFPILTLIIVIVASIHFLPKKSAFVVFASLALFSSIIFYRFGMEGLMGLSGAIWVIGGLYLGKGDAHSHGGDFGGDGGGGDGGGGGD
jgi:uncharacterized membrane protein YgcG